MIDAIISDFLSLNPNQGQVHLCIGSPSKGSLQVSKYFDKDF